MKRFFILCTGVLFSMLCMAESRPIRLTTDPPPPPLENKDRDKRDLVYEPTAAIDGTNIILYSDVAMEMSISIYDANDILVQTLTLTCMGEADFDLLHTLPGEYRIEISCGQVFYYGYFVVD